MVKNLPEMKKAWVPSLGWENPLEQDMVTHSSTLAWRISWTEEPGGLQPMGSQRVGHDWVTKGTVVIWQKKMVAWTKTWSRKAWEEVGSILKGSCAHCYSAHAALGIYLGVKTGRACKWTGRVWGNCGRTMRNQGWLLNITTSVTDHPWNQELEPILS